MTTFYEFFYGEQLPEADEKQVRLRHRLMQQIKLSNLKLKPVKSKKKRRLTKKKVKFSKCL